VKKKFLLKVIVKGAKQEFSPGLGVGVLMSQEVTFDLPEKQFSSPIFAASMADQQKNMIAEVIEVTATEVK